VLDDPTLLNRDPYRHWIARVKPREPIAAAFAGLLTGEAARRGFEARCGRDDIRCKRLAD
jgi:glycine cleavage system H lipoate-binding protein